MSLVQKILPPAKESFQNYRASSKQSNSKRRPFSGCQDLVQHKDSILTQTFLFHKFSYKRNRDKIASSSVEKISRFEKAAKLRLTIIKCKL
jgi:hypothetical protein